MRGADYEISRDETIDFRLKVGRQISFDLERLAGIEGRFNQIDEFIGKASSVGFGFADYSGDFLGVDRVDPMRA